MAGSSADLDSTAVPTPDGELLELVTRHPQAAGAALYVNKAFGSRPLTFLITTLCMLSASFAAAGSLATGFAAYFSEI
jgi:basic amino acid/polyamine antiporter, APA family